MNQLEKELSQIKEKVDSMWQLVEFQVLSGRDALVNADKELAKKVVKRGKKVNDYDRKIDRMCENFFALYNPVAVDLRWVLAILKINANLERIGDSAEGVAQLVREIEGVADPALVEVSRVMEMYDAAIAMLADARKAFDNNDTALAREILKRDKVLNKIHVKTDKVMVKYIQENPTNIDQSLKISGIVRKLERIGDQTTNIAEEVIFYVDAKMVKHKSPKKKKQEDKDKPAPNAGE